MENAFLFQSFARAELCRLHKHAINMKFSCEQKLFHVLFAHLAKQKFFVWLTLCLNICYLLNLTGNLKSIIQSNYQNWSIEII